MKTIWSWVACVDRILRGEATRVTDLQKGQVEIPIFGVTIVLGILGLAAGACSGSFALVNHWMSESAGEQYMQSVSIWGQTIGPYHRAYLQFVASTVKVPLLFLLTLMVTFPSLYVFNTLVGSKLNVTSVLRLLIAALSVNLSVLAAAGPIVAFFGACTDNYPFMVLMNVVVFGASGLMGMLFLLQTLNRLSVAQEVALQRQAAVARARSLSGGGSPPPVPPSAPRTGAAGEDELVEAEAVEAGYHPSPLEPLEGHVFYGQTKRVFGVWMIIFGLVGAQMAWILRPFIGAPNQPFAWLRPRDSNFFESVIQTLQQLFSGS